jgi:hypothetical protein
MNTSATFRHSRRLVAGLAAAVVLSGGGAAALATTSSLRFVPDLGQSFPAAKAKMLERSIPRAGRPAARQPIRPGAFRTTPVAGIPAVTVQGRAQTPFPPAVATTTGSWMTSNGTTMTAVYVGSNPAEPSQGRIVILRQNLLRGTQNEMILSTNATGALTISAAPAGRSAETSGQTANIVLRTATGRTVVLRLASNTVS